MALTRSTETGTDAGSARAETRSDILARLERFGLLIVLVAEMAYFSIAVPHTFPTVANFQIIATSISVLAVAALALMFPLLCGRFDITVGANILLSDIAVTALMGKYHFPLLGAIIVTLAICASVGVFNGIMVAYLGVNSIIGTIGVSTIITGVVEGYTSGAPITNGLSPILTDLSAKKLWIFPALLLIMIGICLIGWFVQTQTPFGRYLVAIGANQEAARLAGLPVRRSVLFGFVCSGFLAGIAGILQVSAEGSGDPNAGGLTFIVPALAAVFLGATTFRPGTFNVPGTILALIFVSTTVSGMTLLGTAAWVSDAFNGAAVVVAVVISSQIRRRRTGNKEMGV